MLIPTPPPRETQLAQRLGVRHLRHLGRAAIPFSEQMYAVICSQSPFRHRQSNSVLLPKRVLGDNYRYNSVCVARLLFVFPSGF
jgi:hypothetical protein